MFVAILKAFCPQVSQLRNEIEEKQGLIAELKDENQKLRLAFEQLQRDHAKLKEDEQDKSKRLNVSYTYESFM